MIEKYALIVDDEEGVAKFAREVLRDLLSPDHYIALAHDIAQARGLVKERVPQLVLSDTDAPVLNEGLEFVRELRADPKYDQTQIILMSGRPQVGKEINVPNVKFLPKPFGVKDLVAILQKSQPSS